MTPFQLVVELKGGLRQLHENRIIWKEIHK